MPLDLTKVAADVLQAHVVGRPIRLPAMTVRDLGVLTSLLRQLDTPVFKLVH